MHLNPIFVSNIQNTYGKAGVSWLQDLPLLLKKVSQLWDFQFLNPMSELSYNFVAVVKMNSTGTISIIKLAPQEHSLINEMKWLKCIERCVPKVYEFDETLNALLMEYLEPGNSLKELVKTGDDDKATKIICQVIRDLQSHQQTECKFQHLSELPKVLSLLKGKINANLLSQAKSLFHDLTIDRSQDVILHGDLHHNNILLNRDNWKVIDPHGYRGDPVAEVGAMMRNPLDCFPKNQPLLKVVERRLQIMADELPFDPQKIKAWSFCMTILSIAWILETHSKIPELQIEIASALNQIKI